MNSSNNDAMLYEPVLQYWFGANTNPLEIASSQSDLWWGKVPELDIDIRERFGSLRERAIQGELETWEATSRGRLALIILLDQFSRNIFRNQLEAFTYDYLAQELCLAGLDMDADQELQPIERVFFYLPLEHSELRVDQVRSVGLFSALLEKVPIQQQELFTYYLDYARKHHVVIERFGRFPHRNKILGRPSTKEELDFLETPDSSF